MSRDHVHGARVIRGINRDNPSPLAGKEDKVMSTYLWLMSLYLNSQWTTQLENTTTTELFTGVYNHLTAQEENQIERIWCSNYPG